MVTITKAALAAAITLGLAGLALCQDREAYDPRECARAPERLRAPSDREKAWGAHLAAVCRMPDLAPAIATELAHTRLDMFERTIDVSGSTIWGQSQWAGYAMLDALIQLRFPLDASVLSSIAQRYPAEAAILMLQDAPRNLSSLAAVRRGPVTHVVWVAASNALARLRAPGFAATLLRELTLINSVLLLDPGAVPGGTVGSFLEGLATTQLPPGFPPVALYSLTTEDAPGRELVSDGPTPVYVQRALVDRNRPITWPSSARCLQCPENCPECQRERSEYLASLAHVPAEEAERAIHPLSIVVWSTRAQLDAAIVRAVVQQSSEMKRLVRRLASTGALENAELRFRLAVRIDDQRSDRSVPLLQVPPVELRIP